MLQFTDPLKACAKCSVTDVYDERGKRLAGLWQKIYVSERMANVFQVSIGGMGQE